MCTVPVVPPYCTLCTVPTAACILAMCSVSCMYPSPQCRQCLIAYWKIVHVDLNQPEKAAALVYEAAFLGVNTATLVPDPEATDGEKARE